MIDERVLEPLRAVLNSRGWQRMSRPGEIRYWQDFGPLQVMVVEKTTGEWSAQMLAHTNTEYYVPISDTVFTDAYTTYKTVKYLIPRPRKD